MGILGGGVPGPVLQIMTLFQTKKSHFSSFNFKTLALLSLVKEFYALSRSQNDKPSNIW